MSMVEEHANWTVSRELGFNYSHAGLVRALDISSYVMKILKMYCVHRRLFSFILGEEKDELIFYNVSARAHSSFCSQVQT